METKRLTLNIPIGLHKKLKLMALMEETTMTKILLKEVKAIVKKYEEKSKK